MTRFLLIVLLLVGAGWALRNGLKRDHSKQADPRDKYRVLRITGFAVLTTGSLAILAWHEGRLRPGPTRLLDIRGEEARPVIWRDHRPVRPARRVIDTKTPPVARRRKKRRRHRYQPLNPNPNNRRP